MKFSFPSTCISLCLLALQFSLSGFAQYSSEFDSSYLLEDTEIDSAIPPFYQGLDEKSYYHARQIYGMKQDMNAHSRNLRDLRKRFNQVFYGRKTSDGGEDPFQVGAPPQLPTKKEVTPRIVYVPPPPRKPRDRHEAPQSNANSLHEHPVVYVEESSPAELLAFSVKEPGSFQSNDGQPIFPDAGINQGKGISTASRKFDYYILTRAGLAIGSKIKKASDLYRRYDPGYNLSISGGVRIDRWRMGVQLLHQQNQIHSNSWLGPRVPMNGETKINALLADFSYLMPVISSLGINVSGAMGYRKTTSSADWLGGSTRKVDDGFVWSVGTGLNWSFSEQVSLLLGYRYFAEETVPTHNIDLGLEFGF